LVKTLVVVPPDAALNVCDEKSSATADKLLLARLQVKTAPATTLADGTVITLDATDPNVPVLPVMALFESVQDTALRSKPDGSVVVTVMAVPNVVTLIAVGDDGVAVDATVVVMFAGVEARLVCAKLNGPPVPPAVVTCSLKVAAFELVKTQVI
jgi:hypothetical protein